MRGRTLVSAVVAVLSLAVPPGAVRADADVLLEGIFAVGGPIRGASLDGDYLYVATPDGLSIYDVSSPASPELLSRRVSARMIHGELISTGGDLLLLNGGLLTSGLDVWNVEDKSNPVLAGSIESVTDEHFSCLLECAWAYGSDGSIVDLRRPQEPVLQPVNWKEEIGIARSAVHRLDEYRPGFMATAPRLNEPLILDVRRPLQPRIVARTEATPLRSVAFLYTTWARRGEDRFVIASTENGPCNDDFQGAVVTFDTKGWPRDRKFEAAGRFRYPGRTDDETCLAYYFSLHPDFEDGGLMLLPNGLEGTRVIEVAPDGSMEQVGSFVLPTSNVWMSFWIDEEVFYALNETGEVYILRFEP